MEKQEPRKAVLKPDWQLPDPPLCDKCGMPAFAAVNHTGDGWVFGWDSDCLHESTDDFWWCDGHSGKGEPYDWPFVEDYVWHYDWETAGITVV